MVGGGGGLLRLQAEFRREGLSREAFRGTPHVGGGWLRGRRSSWGGDVTRQVIGLVIIIILLLQTIKTRNFGFFIPRWLLTWPNIYTLDVFILSVQYIFLWSMVEVFTSIILEVGPRDIFRMYQHRKVLHKQLSSQLGVKITNLFPHQSKELDLDHPNKFKRCTNGGV